MLRAPSIHSIHSALLLDCWPPQAISEASRLCRQCWCLRESEPLGLSLLQQAVTLEGLGGTGQKACPGENAPSLVWMLPGPLSHTTWELRFTQHVINITKLWPSLISPWNWKPAPAARKRKENDAGSHPSLPPSTIIASLFTCRHLPPEINSSLLI